MTNDEVSILIDIFDKAITSDTPAVKNLLQRLLLVTSIADSDNDGKVGPIRDILRIYDKRISDLEISLMRINQKPSYDISPNTIGTWAGTNPNNLTGVSPFCPSINTTAYIHNNIPNGGSIQ